MKTLKVLVISILAISLVLGIALPALANSGTRALKADKEDERENARTQVVTGNVSAINGNVIVVSDKEITTDNTTRYKVPGKKDATLADIQVSMHVVAQTRTDGTTLIARQIVVVPKRPVNVQHTGNVTAYAYSDAAGGNITIQDKSGQTISFAIIAGKFKVLPKGAEVKIGSWVTVTAHRDPAQSRLIATAVVVHRPRLVLQWVTGVVNGLTDNVTGTGNSITIGATVLKYDGNTVFVVKGTPSVKIGQQATAAYYTKSDGSALAKRVWVGVKPPQPKVTAVKPLPTNRTLAKAEPKQKGKDKD